jgi:hypothetical protein
MGRESAKFGRAEHRAIRQQKTAGTTKDFPTALLIGPEKQAHFEHRLTVYGPDLLKRLSLDPLAGRKARGWPVTKKGPARPFRLLCC